MFKGKKLSILGDSISTYKGVSNDASANSTIRYNPYYYYGQFRLEDTYFMRLINSLGMELCVNNSWSGGNLSGRDDPDSGINRAFNLSKDNGEKPDFIIVFMGINDFGRNVSVDTFASDYARTLEIIGENYPEAKVCCVNLPDRYAEFKRQTEIFNLAISHAVDMAGDNFFIADLFGSRLNNDFYYDNTRDGLHPDEDGARIISEIIESAFRDYFAD